MSATPSAHPEAHAPAHAAEAGHGHETAHGHEEQSSLDMIFKGIKSVVNGVRNQISRLFKLIGRGFENFGNLIFGEKGQGGNETTIIAEASIVAQATPAPAHH